jgi:hypothetical protein
MVVGRCCIHALMKATRKSYESIRLDASQLGIHLGGYETPGQHDCWTSEGMHLAGASRASYSPRSGVQSGQYSFELKDDDPD